MSNDVDEMVDGTELLDDEEALRGFLAREGYLLLRGVFPLDLVAQLREGLLQGLEAQGARRVGPEPHRVDLAESDIDIDALHPYVDYSGVYDHPDLLELQRKVLGGPTYTWRSVILRAMGPGREKFRAVPHQDGYFSADTGAEPNTVMRTFWTPLTPVDRTTGGLAVVPRSHLGGLRDVVEADARMANGGGAKFRMIPDDQIEGRWTTAVSMEPGDVIVTHPYTIHQGTPNVSDENLVRISMDWRVQPVETARCLTALYTVPEFTRYLVMDEEGRWSRKPEPTPA
ncbi:MAG: phytanoyl-CoA dioxygenase family protein [Acidimicrobiia bacterium]